jgi:hypothetical protein
MKPSKKDAPQGPERGQGGKAGGDEAQRERLEKERKIMSPDEKGSDADRSEGADSEKDDEGTDSSSRS